MGISLRYWFLIKNSVQTSPEAKLIIIFQKNGDLKSTVDSDDDDLVDAI